MLTQHLDLELIEQVCKHSLCEVHCDHFKGNSLEYVAFFFSQNSQMFSLLMTNAQPMNLIVTSTDTIYGVAELNDNVNIYVSEVLWFFLHR